MLYAVCIGLFTPLVGFLILMALANILSRRLVGVIGCLAILIPFLCFCSIFYSFAYHDMSPATFTLYNWIPVKGIEAGFTLRMDHIALFMTLVITGVGFLIHVYSIGYMEHDEDLARYFACMNFFVFNMLLLVLAGHLVLLFVGWEGVGLASYLLIGYYYTRPSAAQAATKAFVINRIGDCGFLIGLLLIFYTFGTGDIETIIQKLPGFGIGVPVLALITLLLFFGATGKSAQLPLYTWLPDAMEGPTPVSALIHAATMVTAGVYLIVRLHPLYLLTPTALHFVGAIGGFTSLFAAVCAVGQTDLKRVLAYSTISQLGLMFLACGVGAFYAAMFHLMNHAFMKGLLFLSAGNVVHMMRGTTDMGKMGGLAKKFPVTHWLFLIGTLAMSGVPPLAAFFSKDLILEEEYLAGFEVLFYVALVASILTAFYLMRAYILTFWNSPHLENKILNAIKEAPRIMLLPTALLAVLSIVGGFLGFAFGKTPPLEGFLAEVGITRAEVELTSSFVITPETWLSIGGALLGIGLAAFIYLRYGEILRKHPLQILKDSFYVNEFYWKVFAVPSNAFARFIAQWLEPHLFTDSLSAVTKAAQGTARLLQRSQSGQIRSYAAWIVVGAIILTTYLVL